MAEAMSREDLLKAKFAECQRAIFSSGLTVGEITIVLRALQNGLDTLAVNMTPVAPEEAKTGTATDTL